MKAKCAGCIYRKPLQQLRSNYEIPLKFLLCYYNNDIISSFFYFKPGWFGAAPKGQPKMLRHTRVEGVAKSSAQRFLVTTKLPAFTSGSGDLDGYIPHDVMPGEVLKRVCVLDPNPGDPDCPALVRQNGPCLECLDEKDEDVLIPLSRRAMIFEIAEVYPDDMERVFTMAQVVGGGNAKLPRVVKLVQGDPPLLAYAFTGMLRCYSVFTEETILAATLDDASSICLELATDSLARFRLCLNEVSMKRTCEYGNALNICETFGAKFVTGIKVSFSLQPELTDLDDIDMLFYDSQASFSDMQEVEANSEFEISWGIVKKDKLLSSASEDDQQQNGNNKDSSGDDELFLEGLPDSGKDEKMEVEVKGSDNHAVVKKVGKKAGPDSRLPLQREFTEKDIADLMQRKGMIATAGHTDDSTNDVLPDESKVRYNPLYYYFQREAEDQEESSDSSGKYSESKTVEEATKNKRENTGTLAEKDVQASADNLPDLVTNPTESREQTDVSVEDTEGELDTSIYEQVVCTPAKEYSFEEAGENDSSESDNDSDILYDNSDPGTHEDHCNTEQTKTHIPIEANVVVKSMGKRARRSYTNIEMAGDSRMDFRGNSIDTSSSDDFNSDLDRVDKDNDNKGINEFPLQRINKVNNHSALKAHNSDPANMRYVSMTEPSFGESGRSDFTKENFGMEVSTSSGEGFTPLVASPPRPTFTEVDDPLESTMSELDMVTSIKPSGLMSDRNDVVHSHQDPILSSKHSNVSSMASDKSSAEDITRSRPLQWTSEDHLSRVKKDCRDLSHCELSSFTKQRPEPLRQAIRPNGLQARNKKHADVMQEEDRFDSPKVSHHPHVHPHTSALMHGPPGALHLGHWTRPVPLGGVGIDKGSTENSTRISPAQSKILDSIQNFERLSSSTALTNGAESYTANDSIGHKPALIFSRRNSKLFKDDNGENIKNRSYSERDTDTQQVSATIDNYNSAQRVTDATDVLSQSSESSCPPSQTEILQEESDEDVVTIEEHFVVSTNSIASPGANLKVLPVYHEDLHSENFV